MWGRVAPHHPKASKTKNQKANRKSKWKMKEKNRKEGEDEEEEEEAGRCEAVHAHVEFAAMLHKSHEKWCARRKRRSSKGTSREARWKHHFSLFWPRAPEPETTIEIVLSKAPKTPSRDFPNIRFVSCVPTPGSQTPVLIAFPEGPKKKGSFMHA